MKSQKGATVIDYFLFVLYVISIIAITSPLWWPPIACKSKWSESGLVSKWGLVAGCRISLDGGKTYIPEERYRQIEE